MVAREGARADRAVQNAGEKLGLVPALVEADRELMQVALKVLRANPVEGSTWPRLEVSEDGVGSRKAVLFLAPTAGFARPIVDPQLAKRLIGYPGVC